VDARVVDFLRPEFVEAIQTPGPRLFVMFGSTLGNLFREQQAEFLQRIRDALGPDDRILFGIDLVKPAEVLEPAYNDAAGVTEEFNKNVIRVLQRELGANVAPEDFEHRAPFVAERSRIEMRLHAVRDLAIGFADPGMPTYDMQANEYILTEISQKFDRGSLVATLGRSDLSLDQWWTDPERLVALALVRASI
jgi:L-histidine N-alpha-methyltransferase